MQQRNAMSVEDPISLIAKSNHLLKWEKIHGNGLSLSEMDPSITNGCILQFSRGWYCTSFKKKLLLKPSTFHYFSRLCLVTITHYI